MAKKKSRLGKGLGALLGDVKVTTQVESVPGATARKRTTNQKIVNIESTSTGYREIPIELLQRGKYQPRVRMDKDALEQLAESIRSQGVIQPLLVRPASRDQFEIIAGERRWRGAQLAGLATVPAVIREIEDQTAMAVSLIENIQRENLNAMEQAKGFKRLIDEFGLTHQEVSDAVGSSRTAVSNLLRLLSLNSGVQKLVESEQLDMGHARALLGLPKNLQLEIANRIINKGLSVRQTEQLVKNLIKNQDSGTAAKTKLEKKDNADVLRLEDELSAKIGARVEIQHGAKKGKLIIHYHSLDELDGILERIK